MGSDRILSVAMKFLEYMLPLTYGNQHMVSICGGTISVTYVLDIIEVVIRIVHESVLLVDLTSPPASSALSYLFLL